MSGLTDRLREPVDGASVGVFRIAFGLILAFEAFWYLGSGWVTRSYVDPDFYFTFQLLDWVQPWPGIGMYAHFAVLGVLALMIALGVLYRPAAVLFFLAFTYMFLLDKAEYLNHFYAVCLLALLLIAIPADRCYSIAARRRPARTRTVPLWCVWILRGQVGLLYIGGGIAKLNSDWLQGEPMRMWLADRTDFPLIGSTFTDEWAAWAFSYGGMILDLAVVPLLLWRRTRPYAYAAAVLFHLTNWQLFNIGIFPWMMIAATLIFFPADWPRTLAERVRGAARRPAIPMAERPRHDAGIRARHALPALLAAYIAIQVLVPFRHHAYPGDVNWTEEGHRFSWHMMLRTKSADARFFAVDPRTGGRWELDHLAHITLRQERKMAARPDMVLQMARHLAALERRAGREVEVRAEVRASLNGRPRQHLVDPERDLASEPRNLTANDWIMPQELPLR